MNKLLVANRGEIAVRIFRTCRRLGIATVAVAAPDDRDALHTRVADGVAGDLELPRRRRACSRDAEAAADAVHPGYGFLAESAELAEAVEAAGLAFVGPTAEALRRAATSSLRRRSPARPAFPSSPDGEPEEIGFPLIVKAAAGGGGRGMRVVRVPGELEEALAAARREARRPSATTASSASATSSGRATSRSSCSPTARGPSSHSASASARSSGATRRCSRSPRPERSTTSCGAAMSDAAVAFAAPIGYRSAGHGRVHGRRPRLLLPRAERPHPGRASRDGARHGRRPRRAATPHREGEGARRDSARRKGTRSKSACTRRIPDVPAADRPHLTPRAAVGGACRRGSRRRRRDRP